MIIPTAAVLARVRSRIQKKNPNYFINLATGVENSANLNGRLLFGKNGFKMQSISITGGNPGFPLSSLLFLFFVQRFGCHFGKTCHTLKVCLPLSLTSSSSPSLLPSYPFSYSPSHLLPVISRPLPLSLFTPKLLSYLYLYIFVLFFQMS